MEPYEHKQSCCRYSDNHPPDRLTALDSAQGCLQCQYTLIDRCRVSKERMEILLLPCRQTMKMIATLAQRLYSFFDDNLAGAA
jgi:hypothetical protein